MSKTLRWVLVAVVVIAILGGVAAFYFLSGSTSLDGSRWRLDGWSASSLDPADFMITATFLKGEISGQSAVNSYSGPYKAGRLGAFSAGPLSSTLIAGPEDAMRAEQIYLELLDQAASYERSDTKLTLLDDNGNQLLIFEPMK